MTQDEIIAMARHSDREWDCDRDMYEWLETFAKLVAAHAREDCAHIADEWGPNNMTATSIASEIRARGNT